MQSVRETQDYSDPSQFKISLQIENTSELSIQFSIRLDSHLVHSQPRLQLVTDPATCKNFVGGFRIFYFYLNM